MEKNRATVVDPKENGAHVPHVFVNVFESDRGVVGSIDPCDLCLVSIA